MGFGQTDKQMNKQTEPNSWDTSANVSVQWITKEEREELLEEGRIESKEDCLWKTANTSGIQGVNIIQD